MSALLIAGLVKRFGGLTATDNVSLELGDTELHAIIGPNGAGKSTLIGQISGEIKPDAGRIEIAGRDVTSLDVADRARLGLARSYQISQVCKDLTAFENVLMAALSQVRRTQADRSSWLGQLWTPLLQDKALNTKVYAALEQAGLADDANRSAAQLAHGQQRQLEIAIALALEPKILLLDEPLAGMSKSESETMVSLLQSLKGRYPILLIEHDMDAVFALADRISVLVYGAIIAVGTPETIRANPKVREAYLGDEGLNA